MKQVYLEVTFCTGDPLAAYLYLPRQEGDRTARVEKHGTGLLVDLSDDERPIGIEIAIPSLVTVEAVNNMLGASGGSARPDLARSIAPKGRNKSAWGIAPYRRRSFSDNVPKNARILSSTCDSYRS